VATVSRQRRKRQSGNTLVEFALSFFLIFWTFSGLTQFGYSFYAYNVLMNAVRNGARYGSNYPYSSATLTPDSTYSSNVQNMVVYGTISPANNATPILTGLVPTNVSVTMSMTGACGSICPPTSVTVSIVNFSLDAVFNTVNLNGHPTATFAYTGILTPPSS
jgi:Flp pilus assembly protein TadG